MPVYEYFCRSCNSRYEKLRPLRDVEEPATCPTCDDQNSVRTLSVFIVHGGEGRSLSRDNAYMDTSSAGGGCGCGGHCSCASPN